MAPSFDEDPLARVREVRGADQLQDTDRAALEEFRRFLQAKEAESVRSATHTVLENYPDWWCKGRRAPPGLTLEGDRDLDELNRVIGKLHAMGIPLTLAEKRTSGFRFFQDLEAWGTRETSIAGEDLIGPECDLALLLGKVIGEVFPSKNGFLDAAVYDATGMSQTKGVRKTSVRLVWPSITVDSDRAARVRDLVVHRLVAASAETGPVAELEARLREFSSSNAWHSVFGDAAYGQRSNVRLPLCDRVSPLPLRAPERRPLVAVGVLRFNFDGAGTLTNAEWLCRQNELDGAEWVKIGSLRQSADMQLTDWTMPAWTQAQPIPPSSVRASRVKVRTAGGSDNMVTAGGVSRVRALRAAPTAPERAGQLLTVERIFSGSPELFCEKMEPHLGKPVIEPDGSYVWKQPGGEARIVMYTEEQRVKVIGRPNQVRSLVVIVAPYTEALQQMGCPLASRTNQPQLPPGGRAASAAFAPEVVPAAAAAPPDSDSAPFGGNAVEPEASLGNVDGAVADATAPSAAVPLEWLRVAKEAFEPQGQGELALAEGDLIVVSHDPEGDFGSGEDRWVYGRNEASDRCGWFPLSHTVRREDNSPPGSEDNESPASEERGV